MKSTQSSPSLHRLWYLVSHTLIDKGSKLDACPLIINITLLVKMSNFLKYKKYDLYHNRLGCVTRIVFVLEKNNIEHGNNKCDVVTLKYGLPCWSFM